MDPDEIRNARQYDFFKPKKPKQIDPFKVFLSVLAAILVAWFVRAWFIQWQVNQVTSALSQQVQVMNAKMQADIESQIAADKERARLHQEEVYQQKLAKHQLALEKQAALEYSINERTKKAQAWDEYYKPVRGCEPSIDNKDLMMCANDHARAKKKFEELWTSGQLIRGQ